MDLAIDQLEKYSRSKIKLSVVKKRELLEILNNSLKSMTAQDLKKQQDGVVEILISQPMSSSGGKPMMRAIVRCINKIFENGDYSKVQQTFVDPLVSAVSNNQDKDDRLGKLYVLSKMFQSVKQSCFCGSPPTKELIDALAKIGNKSSDQIVKIHAYKALTRVIKAGTQNISISVPDLIKNYTKMTEKLMAPSTQAEYELKVQCVKGLKVLVTKAFSFSMLSDYFEQLQKLCFKGFLEDAVPGDACHCQFQGLLAALYGLRLEETRRHGDIKMSFKVYQDSLTQGQEKSKKKSSIQCLEAPRTLAEIVSYFSALLFKQAQQPAFTDSLSKCLSMIIKSNVLDFQATDLDHFINSLLLSLQTKQSKESKDSAEKTASSNLLSVCSDVIIESIAIMTDEQRKIMTELITSTLDKRQLMMSRDTVEWFSPHFNSAKDKLRVSSMINSHEQAELCLKAYGVLVSSLSEGQIFLIFQNEMNLITPILRYIRDDSLKVSTQVEAKKVVSVIAQKVKDLQWLQNLLYQFLQLTTIENADLQTLSLGDAASLDSIEQKQRNLNTLAECMSYFLKSVTHKSTQEAVPLALAESTLKGAKSLILGSFAKSDSQEKEAGIVCYSIALKDVIDQEEMGQSRREAGWILVEGLLGLGEAWTRQNIDSILTLFYSIFNADICVSKGFNKVAQILREFDLKLKALSALAFLVKTYRKSLLQESKAHLKLVSQMLGNCLQFLFNNAKDPETQELLQIFQKASPRSYKEAKLQILESILIIDHPSYFQPKMILILHNICEQIVSPKRLNDAEGSLFPHVVSSTEFYQKSENGLRAGEGVVPTIADQTVKISIQLFTSLYLTKSALTQKNKLQLIKHLESHSVVDSAKKETMNPSKLLKIALTALSLVKGNVERLEEGSQAYNHSPLEEDILERTTKISLNLYIFQGQCPGLEQVLGELILYTNMQLIKRDSGIITQLLAEEAMTITTQSILIASLFRVFDYETVLAESLDIDTHVNQFFKKSFTLPELSQSEAAAMVFSMQQIYEHSEMDLLPKGFSQTLLQQAIHGLHVSKLNGRFDHRNQYFLAKLISQMIDNQDDVTQNDLVGYLIENEFDISASTRKVGSPQQYSLVNWNREPLIVAHALLLKQRILNDKNMAIELSDPAYLNQKTQALVSIYCSQGCDNQTKVKIIEVFSAILMQRSPRSMNLPDTSVSEYRTTSSLSQILLNLLNHEYRCRSDQNEGNDIVSLKVDQEGLEALILDFQQDNSLQQDPIRALKICCSLALKQELSAALFVSPEHGYKHLNEYLKFMTSWKYSDAYYCFQDSPSPNFQHDDEGQFFWEDLHEQTIFQYACFFYSYLKQLQSKDIEPMNLKAHLYSLVTLSFKISQRDQVIFKRLGVQMLTQVVEIFKDIVETIGDVDSDEDADQAAAKGPLLLEQYEAQFHSVIRSSLQNQLQSFMFSSELLHLIEQFLTLGICTDSSVKAKTLEQLQEIYVSRPSKADQANKQKHLDYMALSQMYPEKICANAYAQKLALINKIQPAYNSAMLEAYLKILRDFLIVTCAQAQDQKNPNCIKDIKSLKLLYPSGLGCAIDMRYMINCVISILSLTGVEDSQESEIQQLKFQCVIQLLCSQPESLLLPKKDDTLETLRIRSKVLVLLTEESNQGLLQESNLGQLLQVLKGNFELGISSICAKVVAVYAKILQKSEKGKLHELQLGEIQRHIFSLQGSATSELQSCNLQLLGHIDNGPGMHAAAKSCFEPEIKAMVSLAKDDSESLMQLNKMFANSLKTVQNLKTSFDAPMIFKIGHAVVEVITEQLQDLKTAVETDKNQKKLQFLNRGLYMMSFYAQKICQSPSQKLLSISSTLEPGTNRDMFVLTMLKLTMQENEINTNLGQSLAVLVLSMIQNIGEDGETESDQNVFIMSCIGFIVKFYEGLKEQNSTKLQLLQIIIAAIFRVMQSQFKGLSNETKNKVAQQLVQLVNLDLVTFKQLAQADSSQSDCYLTQQEKTVIQNLMIRVQQAQSAQKK